MGLGPCGRDADRGEQTRASPGRFTQFPGLNNWTAEMPHDWSVWCRLAAANGSSRCAHAHYILPPAAGPRVTCTPPAAGVGCGGRGGGRPRGRGEVSGPSGRGEVGSESRPPGCSSGRWDSTEARPPARCVPAEMRCPLCPLPGAGPGRVSGGRGGGSLSVDGTLVLSLASFESKLSLARWSSRTCLLQGLVTPAPTFLDLDNPGQRTCRAERGSNLQKAKSREGTVLPLMKGARTVCGFVKRGPL